MRSSFLFLLAVLATVVGCENFGIGPAEAPLISSGDVVVIKIDPPQPDVSPPPPGPVDEDGDGVTADKDCDDKDALVLLPRTWYQDADGDGWGSNVTSGSCAQPKGYVGQTGDCNDIDGKIYPGATEVCNAKDDDCNGSVDDAVGKIWYLDADGDGHGDPLKSITDGCDGKNFLVASSDDCDDANPNAYPGATEVCDGADNDCNGQVDDKAKDSTIWYKDADGDGFGRGDPVVSVKSCVQPLGYAKSSDDCADEDKNVHPGQPEVCNDVDDDCNGQIDEGVKTTYYADEDKDGFGNPLIAQDSCAPVGKYIADNTDCDDQHAAAHPGGVEVCDGLDNDCNGDVDSDAIDMPTWYADLDGDGYGSAPKLVQCKKPDGFVDNATDCNDASVISFPGAAEICDGLDNDCDGQIDENDAIDASTWFRDADGDGFGDSLITFVACAPPLGYVQYNLDCDDANPAANPAATEVCDFKQIDEDCNGLSDDQDPKVDPASFSTWHPDLDGDGYGNASDSKKACVAPPGYIADGTDCNDVNNTMHPGAKEVCNGIDDNCDGQIDEGVLNTYYVDVDGDGFGNSAISKQSCAPTPAGFASKTGDCDDGSLKVNPMAPEICDGLDNDCDGKTDEVDPPAFNLCDDKNNFTVDKCDAQLAKCAHDTVNIKFTCHLPDGYPWEDGWTCGSAAWFDAPEGADNDVSISDDTLVLPAQDACATLSTGAAMHANGYVVMASDPSSFTWVGGLYVTVTDTVNNTPIEGTPGNVTLFTPGLDFDYVLDDLEVCQPTIF